MRCGGTASDGVLGSLDDEASEQLNSALLIVLGLAR